PRLACLLAGRRLLTSSEPEPEVDAADAARGRVAERRAHAPREAVPRPAPDHPERAQRRRLRVLCCRVLIRIRLPDALRCVLTPLVHVAEHVVQSVRIRRLPPDRMRLSAAVASVPGDGIELG